MANISHFTQTVNGVSTTYDIRDANAIPRSGGNVITGDNLARTDNNNLLKVCGGTENYKGGTVALYGKDSPNLAGTVVLQPSLSSSSFYNFILYPDGTATWGSKNLAMQEDVIPRSGGAVVTGSRISKTVNYGELSLDGGTGYGNGSTVTVYGKDNDYGHGGCIIFINDGDNTEKRMRLYPDGTWTWNGQPVQTSSDARLKQQIAEIDDKLLDAWEDVTLCQFKYNDAVDQKGKSARLHTGYVVQQIQKACESHGVDISAYGLFCHEEYPEETEEVEVTQKDGTKAKEIKVIREASEHYSLRYTEALIVECKYLRKCIKELRNEIEELKSSK